MNHGKFISHKPACACPVCCALRGERRPGRRMQFHLSAENGERLERAGKELSLQKGQVLSMLIEKYL